MYLIFAKKVRWKAILLCLSYFAVLIFLLPLQYDDIRASTFIFPLMWVSVIVVVYKVFYATAASKRGRLKLGVLCFAFLAVYCLAHSIPFCAWTSFGEVYENKGNSRDRIMIRGYSCFLTDTDPYLYEVRYLTSNWKWVTEFHGKVDTTRWRRIGP